MTSFLPGPRKAGSERTTGSSRFNFPRSTSTMVAAVVATTVVSDATSYIVRSASTGVPVRLHAVGPFATPDYERSVRQLTASLGLEPDVTWAGFQSDITSQFARMHLFVLPSLFGEGLPMVLLEAMAAGLPVVSTRVEGIPQLVRNDRDGLLVEPGNVSALANALLLFARGHVNREAMGDSGWQRQREHFSDISMGAGVAKIYREVLQT